MPTSEKAFCVRFNLVAGNLRTLWVHIVLDLEEDLENIFDEDSEVLSREPCLVT